LGEIEAVLGEHAGVREAVVLVREGGHDDSRLAAYIVAAAGMRPRAVELRDYLRERLPEYMVPAAFYTLDALPLTSNGKINRKALLATEAAAQEEETSSHYAAPQSEVERSLAALWQQALKVERVGVHDNFFDLGGHSLLMAQVQSQLREKFGREIPLVKILEHPTISSLANYLSREAEENFSARQSQDRARKQRKRMSFQKRGLVAAELKPGPGDTAAIN
jgi:acyl carrier protein